MLEGQVAALSSGLLSRQESVQLLEALRDSKLYRADVDSYLLYPDKELPAFLEMNVANSESVQGNPVLQLMLADKDARIIQSDVNGRYRFAGDFRNSSDLRLELERIRDDYADLLTGERIAEIETIFENRFNHLQFIGRSSTFFA